MKKITLLLLLCISFSAHAQFSGAFYHADPDAWFDKEPYFLCQNNYVYNGWGQNLQNITAVVNGENMYSFPYIWQYGSSIKLGKESGVEFSSGDVVSLYCGNYCIGTWTYKPSSAYVKKRAGKGAGKIIKRAWKYVKKLR